MDDILKNEFEKLKEENEQLKKDKEVLEETIYSKDKSIKNYWNMITKMLSYKYNKRGDK